MGSAAGGILTIIEQHNIILNKGPLKVSPFTVPSMIANMPAGYISIYHNAKGPLSCTVTACATGTNCVQGACREPTVTCLENELVSQRNCNCLSPNEVLRGFCSPLIQEVRTAANDNTLTSSLPMISRIAAALRTFLNLVFR